MTDQTFVIVGAGLAAAKAAETLRAEGFAGRVVLVGEEAERPYERPPLSKGYLLGKDPRDNAYVHEAGWYDEHRVELRLGTPATALDPSGHTLTLDGGAQIRYDKLLLATGSRVRTLDVPGADLAGVRTLRTLPDADELRAAIATARNVVVVGAGWIGLETAAAAREHGAAVSVVEVERKPLCLVLGEEVAEVFADLHREHGVTFHFNSGVQEITGTGGRAGGVVLRDGTELPADLVIVGVGIRPATELAEMAGLEVADGVLTDERLRTSHPDIYACGDVAKSHNPMLGTAIRVEHWGNALAGGPAAAKSMLGGDSAPVYDPVPYFFTDQYDLGMEYAGYVGPDGYEEVVFRGDRAGREFIAFWLSGGRVLAGMNVNVWDVTDAIQDLVRAGYAGEVVDTARLADPDVPIGELTATR